MRVLVHRADCQYKGSGYNILNQFKEKIGWEKELALKDAVMVVIQSDRLKQQETGSRILHAWVEGEILDCPVSITKKSVKVSYRPSSPTFFIAHTGKPIYSAELIQFCDKGLFI